MADVTDHSAVILAALAPHGIKSKSDLLLRYVADGPFIRRSLIAATGMSAEAIEEIIAGVAATEVPTTCPLSAAVPPLSHVSTGCPKLDATLLGGWSVGHLTEVAGEAGAGKTQLALQSLVAAVTEDWASRRKAVYLVSEDFPTQRLRDLASVAADRLRIDPDDVLRRIFVRNVRGFAQFDAVAAQLRGLLAGEDGKGISLVVVDSIAALVNENDDAPGGPAAGGYDGGDGVELNRGQLTVGVAATLREIAYRDRVAVLAINQVRFRPALGTIAPALGSAWASAVGTSLMLTKASSGNMAESTGAVPRSLRPLRSAELPMFSPISMAISKTGIQVVGPLPEHAQRALAASF